MLLVLFGYLLGGGVLFLADPVAAQTVPNRPVQVHVDQIDVHLLTSGDTRVDVSGHITNSSLAPLQRVQARLQISADSQQEPMEVAVPPIADLEPLGRQSFGITHTFSRQYVTHPLIRTASLTYRPVNPLQIADWILGSAAQQLVRLQIPFDQRILSDLPLRRQTALIVLRAVPEGHPDYAEARRKRGQILLVWAQELIALGRRSEALKLLRQVEADTPYGEEAKRLLR